MSTTGLESEVSNLSVEAKPAPAAEKAQKAPKPKKDAPILLKCAKVFTSL